MNEAIILVIEPSKVFQEILAALIAELGLSATFLDDANLAVEEVNLNKQYRLILCASSLPGLSGKQLSEQIRPILGEAIPILLLTSVTDKELIREAMHSGITEVIQRNNLIEIQPYLQKIANYQVEPKHQEPNILFVEDSIAITELTMSNLQKNGYLVDSTDTVQQAISLLEENEYDLVITDILLEGNLTGMNLIRHIRNLEEPKNHLPIWAISGLQKDSQRIESLRLGATDFINKPLNYIELNVRVDNLVRTKRLFDRVYNQGKQLEKLAMNDALTGLYNRHYLSDIMPKRLNEAKRHHQPLSIILLDLDLFKQLNDQYGHLHGDQVLKDVSKVLLDNCREEDFAVRFGGEEFILVLPHCELEHAKVKAQNLNEQIKKLPYANHQVTASLGVASVNVDMDLGFNELFKLADEALYQAKNSGRDCVKIAQ